MDRIKMAETILRVWPQTKLCDCWPSLIELSPRQQKGTRIVDLDQPCQTCGPDGSGNGIAHVTAEEFARFDAHSRPTGWMWRLWSTFGRKLIATEDGFWAEAHDHVCGENYSAETLTASDAILVALYWMARHIDEEDEGWARERAMTAVCSSCETEWAWGAGPRCPECNNRPE